MPSSPLLQLQAQPGPSQGEERVKALLVYQFIPFLSGEKPTVPAIALAGHPTVERLLLKEVPEPAGTSQFSAAPLDFKGEQPSLRTEAHSRHKMWKAGAMLPPPPSPPSVAQEPQRAH